MMRFTVTLTSGLFVGYVNAGSRAEAMSIARSLFGSVGEVRRV